MKVILTGVTGLIGHEVLSRCISNPAITAIIALTRREIPISNPKLTIIVHEDFTIYPPSLLQKLKGAEACIWCLGMNWPKTPEEDQRVNVDYTLAAARAFATRLDRGPRKTFRFIYLSGMYVEKDQEKSLWFLGDQRRRKGRLELELQRIGQDAQRGGFELFIARPGGVFGKDNVFVNAFMGLWNAVMGLSVVSTISVDTLAMALVDIAEKGGEQRVWEMEHLKGRSRSLPG